MNVSTHDNPRMVDRSRKKPPAGSPLQRAYGRLQAGDYQPEVLDMARALCQKKVNQGSIDDLEVVTAVNFIAEVFDYHGLYEDAREVVRPHGAAIRTVVEALIESPEWARGQSPESEWLWRARIYLLLNLAHTHYRDEKYQTALDILEVAKRGLDTLDPIDGKKPESFRPRWRVYYRIGQTQRQLNRFQEAHTYFALAIDQASTRLSQKAPRGGQSDGDDSDGSIGYNFRVAHWAVAKCLVLGLGWLQSAKGHPDEAIPLITAGRTLLYNTHDWVHLAYADLLKAAAMRAKAGPNPRELDDVIRILLEVYEKFSPKENHHGHQPYRLRTAFQLAHAYHYRRDTTMAKQYVQEVIDGPHDRGARTQRWNVQALTLLSRIERDSKDPRDRSRSLKTAQRALKAAEDSGQDWCKADALIACGEAQFEASLGESESTGAAAARAIAVAHWNEANRLSEDNPERMAACCLHLARAAAAEGKVEEAEHHWSVWADKLAGQVKSAWVHDHSKVVKAELLRSRMLVIDANDGLNYKQLNAKLQQFLLARASVQAGGNLKKLAELLGVSRQTIYEWKKAIGEPE